MQFKPSHLRGEEVGGRSEVGPQANNAGGARTALVLVLVFSKLRAGVRVEPFDSDDNHILRLTIPTRATDEPTHRRAGACLIARKTYTILYVTLFIFHTHTHTRTHVSVYMPLYAYSIIHSVDVIITLWSLRRSLVYAASCACVRLSVCVFVALQ